MGATKGQYAAVNGLQLYYEIHGVGAPLVLVHGGLGTIDAMWGELLLSLAQNRQVIAVELQAHGHTGDSDRPLRYEFMADDLAALLQQLDLAQADVLGYSLGGGVALQFAIRHPALVHKLVAISTPYKRDGWFPEVLAGMAALNATTAKAMEGNPIHQAYVSVAPKPENWANLLTKVGELLQQDYDWSAAMAQLTAPTLIIVGDGDSIRPAHALEMFGLLGGGKTDGAMSGLSHSRLAVLPATTHFTVVTQPALLLPLIEPFLDAPLPTAS